MQNQTSSKQTQETLPNNNITGGDTQSVRKEQQPTLLQAPH